MVSGMRREYPRGLNKGLGLKFRDDSRLRQEGSRVRREGSRVRQEIPEGRRAHRPKRCTNNNEDEDNSLNNTINWNLCRVPSWPPASKTASHRLLKKQHQLRLKSVAEAVSLKKNKTKENN